MDKRSVREIESRGVTVEAAITAGLLKLSLSRDDADIEIIDEGSRGLLGIGSREAVVRIRPHTSEAAPVKSAAEAPQSAVVVREPEPPKAVVPVPAPVAPTPKAEPKQEQKPRGRTESTSVRDEDEGDSEEELAAEREAAVATLTELLAKMHVDAELVAELSEPDDLTGQRINVIEITGDDLGMLIGPRGETLDSLQFLTRLMVAHQLHRRAHFVLDIEGYRQRRQQALTRLAERMAEKATQRGTPVSLEPMSSYERRVIHMALRDSPDVYTESTGEGKYRKVRIFPKSS